MNLAEFFRCQLSKSLKFAYRYVFLVDGTAETYYNKLVSIFWRYSND